MENLLYCSGHATGLTKVYDLKHNTTQHNLVLLPLPQVFLLCICYVHVHPSLLIKQCTVNKRQQKCFTEIWVVGHKHYRISKKLSFNFLPFSKSSLLIVFTNISFAFWQTLECFMNIGRSLNGEWVLSNEGLNHSCTWAILWNEMQVYLKVKPGTPLVSAPTRFSSRLSRVDTASLRVAKPPMSLTITGRGARLGFFEAHTTFEFVYLFKFFIVIPSN